MKQIVDRDSSMEAIERLYREEGARLERALVLFAGDREVARDAVAEAFAQAIRRGPAIRAPNRWVWSVAFRIAAGDLKSRGRTLPEVEPMYAMSEPVIDLVRALRALSPKQRECVVLHHYAGYPTKDVARMIGSTTGAVTVHLAVGRRRLRELLEDPDE